MPTSKPEKKEPKKPLSVNHPELAQATRTHKKDGTPRDISPQRGVSRKLVKGTNDLATLFPDLAKELIDGLASEITRGSGEILLWRCTAGHTYKASPASRVRGRGCPNCAGKVLNAGFNDLKSKFPEIAAEADGWDPTTVTAYSGLKRKWKCERKHIWTAAVGSRTGEHKTGCPTCAPTGYDPSQDAFLYFLEHPHWEMFQIGITNFPNDRLSKHKNLGWELLELRGPMDGHLTQQWETAILRMLKKKGADLSNEKIAGKFDGFSEAWTKATFPVDSIKKLMRLTDEYEENLGEGRRVE